jgi:hypothetical protein
MKEIKTETNRYMVVNYCSSSRSRDRRGRDLMVVGFKTTYAISAYHHWCCEFESRSEQGVQHYVIKFVSDLRQIGGFLPVLRFPTAITLTAIILLKYYWKWCQTPSNKQTSRNHVNIKLGRMQEALFVASVICPSIQNIGSLEFQPVTNTYHRS